MCHERAFASEQFLFFLLSNQAFVFLVRALLYLCSSSLLSFLLIQPGPFFPSVWLLLCLRQAFHGGTVLAAQQSLRTRTRGLAARCIQLRLLSESTPPHAQESQTRARTHTHTRSSADRSHTSLHPDGLSSTSQRKRMTDLHRLKRCQLFIPGLIPVGLRDTPRRPPPTPTAQEAQREDDKLSIRPGSGEFSSCLHILGKT